MIEAPTELTKITEAGMMSRLAAREKVAGILSASQLRTPQDRTAQYSRLEAMIGNTPLDFWRLTNGNTLWIKRESENPSESHYDRISVRVLKRLEQEGLIKPGDHILEGTSGSAGRSFAWACNRLGFKLDMIVPHRDEFPKERAKDMEALGANLIYAEEHGGVGKVVRKYKRMLVELKSQGYTMETCTLEGKPIMLFRKGGETIVAPNHSEIIITVQGFRTVADEVIAQMPKGKKVDIFIGTVGNGSTLKGISEGLRKTYGKVVVVGVEHKNSPTNAIRKLREEVGEEKMVEAFMSLYGFAMPTRSEMTYHDSFGASTPGYEPPFVEVDQLDSIVLVDNEWRDFKRDVNTYAWLAGHPRNIIGNTTAENIYLAMMLSDLGRFSNKNILVLNYDKADQYADWPPELRTYEYPLKKPQSYKIPYIPSNLAA